MSRTSFSYIGKGNRRRDRRLIEPGIEITIEGTCYPAADLSLGGFRIVDFHGDIDIGDQMSVHIDGVLAGHHLQAYVQAVVARMKEENHEFGAYFTGIDKHAWDVLEQLAIRRLRRKSQAETDFETPLDLR